METRCIGYDVRDREAKRELGYDGNPPRERHLLRPDVGAPLSVDARIWPSMFHLEGLAGAPSAVPAAAPQSAGSIPVTAAVRTLRQEALQLWHEPVEMKRYFQLAPTSAAGVAISISLVLEGRREWRWTKHLEGDPKVAPIPNDWIALGYDVADGDLMTFLSDSFTEEESKSLRPRWAGRLNSWGLFEEVDDAATFRDLSEPLVEEHGPLYVYGLHRDPDLWRGGAESSGTGR